MYHIYGLVDPILHVVRYVGKTTQAPGVRIAQHLSGHDLTTAEWIGSLPKPPDVVILETGEDRRVPIRPSGKRRVRMIYAKLSTLAETKWIKRFRRGLINRKLRGNCQTAWDALSNTSEWEDMCREQ